METSLKYWRSTERPENRSLRRRLGQQTPKFVSIGRPNSPLRVLAALNVVAFSTFLGVRSPEYELLAAKDQQLRAGGGIDFSTVDPIHFAGRPFYSSAHVPGVPLVENLYFVLNTPAMLAALWVAYPLASSGHEWWTGSVETPSAWHSWALAISFGLAGLVWAFAVGAVIDW